MLPIENVRKALYKYTKPRLTILKRRTNGFDRVFHHISDVLIHKAVKDIMIRDYIKNLATSSEDVKTITLADTKRLFFDIMDSSKPGLKSQNATDAPY